MKTFTIETNGKCNVNGYDFSDKSTLVISGENIEVKDEYHSMHELYQHRMALNLALFHVLDNTTDIHDYRVYKSKNHHPNSDQMFEGYFIVFCLDTTSGAWTSYHYDLKHWDEFNIPSVISSPHYPEGHVSAIEFFSKLIRR